MHVRPAGSPIVAPRRRALAVAVTLALAPAAAHGAAVTPGEAPASAPAEAVGAAPGAAPGSTDRIEFTLAPVRWWGDLAYDLRLGGGSSRADEVSHILTGNLYGSSFIWQPWFAQVRGNLGFVQQYSDYGDTNNADSQSLVGGASVQVFPVSRFPFQAYFDVSDSRASGDITGSDYRNTRFGVNQSYSPAKRNERYYASYEQSILETTTTGAGELGAFTQPSAKDTVRSVRGSAFKGFQKSSVDLQAALSENTRDVDDSTTRYATLVARHNYRPSAGLTMDNLVSFTGDDLQQEGALTQLDRTTQLWQASSFTNWRPAEGEWLHSPDRFLYVTGNLRAAHFQQETNGQTNELQSLNGSLGINYDLRNGLRLFSSTGLGYFTSDETNENNFFQTLGASYTAMPIPLGRWQYQWGASLSDTFANSSSDGSRNTLTGSANQNVSRSVPMWGGNGTLTFSQSVAQTLDTRDDSITTLGNGVSASWSGGEGPTLTFASASFSDSRSFGGDEREFQIANLQFTRQAAVSRTSSWSGNVTVQASRFSGEVDPLVQDFVETDTGWQILYGVNLTYTNVRAFGVPRLRYSALLTGNSQEVDTREQGNVDARSEQISLAFENRLDYSIVRTDLRLSGRIADIDGRQSWIVFFRVIRRFGAL